MTRDQNIALPKGFKGMVVTFDGMAPREAGGKRLYKGWKFMIESAIWFRDYADRPTVMFKLFQEKHKFRIKCFPANIANAKHRNFRKVAAAMLKNAGVT